MKSIEVKPGLLVVAGGALAVITKCLPGSLVEVEISKSRKKKTFDIENIEYIDPGYDPDKEIVVPIAAQARSLTDDFGELEIARVRFEVIGQYRSKQIGRSEACCRLGVSNGMFYRLLRMYDKDAGLYSLIRLKRGPAPGVLKIDEEVEGFIASAIKTSYEGKSATIARVWRKVEQLCIGTGKKAPSINTVAARVKSFDQVELYKKKYGHEAAQQKYQARPGKLITHAPLEFVQMDHTKVDVIVVDEKDRRPIGRPWLTVVLEKNTRVMLGYYLALHAPSSLSVACAISHAILPKKAFMEQLGRLPAEYPYYGKFKIIHMDNAKEFKTTGFQKACARNDIEPKWRPLGRKHYGGHIERLIGTMMNEYIHFLPGSTMSNTVQRKGVNSEKEASLTFREFCRWFAGEVAIYHGRVHRALGCSPSEVWNRYFANHEEGPRHPPMVARPMDLRMDFMPEERRTIRPDGVSLYQCKYWSPTLRLYVGHNDVTIKYDPFSMKTIWARLNNEYEPLTFSDQTLEDCTLEDIRLRNRRARNGALTTPSLIGVVEENEQLVRESVKLTKKERRKVAAFNAYHGVRNAAGSAPKAEKSTVKNERPDYSKKSEPFRRVNK
ncbi:Mu transposase C-terminal domain-containing protein [Pseudomonas sp. NFIX28]|uniref:Mu transposase C-terminal domain-containing protein n=1 Tax=Pseudomonas sp. NFIX28 TaxID=1566235 RepID=UPI0008977AAF|nr:Mu transposase C-terminal domain-containing protein [Pseudomonas sp. NFIX28]SDY43502.1 putative transposase [Pseudomonas sp. NFIX28]